MIKLRYIWLTIAVFTTGFSSFAQMATNEAPSLKPSKDWWGLTFNVTGLIDNIALSSIEDVNGQESVFLRYYYTDDVVFRAGFGLNSINHNLKTTTTEGDAEIEYDSTFAKTNIYFAPGIEKHLGGTRRLDPYIGANLVFGALGASNIDISLNSTDTLGTEQTNIAEERAGGFAFGLRAVAGFNYFFSDKLALGAEYQFGFDRVRDGGDFSRSTTVIPVSGSSTSTRETGASTTTTSGFAMQSTAGITLSYFFTRGKSTRKTSGNNT